MCQSTRRDFVRRTLIGSLICSIAEPFVGLVSAKIAEAPRYDLLIKGGKVIDPAQKLSAVRDVGIAGGKVVRLAEKPRRSKPATCSTPPARSSHRA